MINREEIIKCLGHFSKKVDLNINELESIDMGDYVRKLIEYHVEKCEENIRIQNKDIIEKVQAYVLIPKNLSKKIPGIVAIHQHNSNWKIGKSEVVGITNNSMYSYGLDLVKQGYVVIAPDILCFESRLGNDEYGKDKEGQRFFERFEAFKLITEGSTLQAKTLNDLSATIDVLSSFEFVDSNLQTFHPSSGAEKQSALRTVQTVFSSDRSSVFHAFISLLTNRPFSFPSLFR